MRLPLSTMLLALGAGLSFGSSPARADDGQQALRTSLFKRATLDIPAPSAPVEKVRPSAFPPPLLPTAPFTPTLPPLDSSLSSGGLRELAVQPAGFTPYDRYLGTVRNVMARSNDGPATMLQACRAMKQAHAFRYRRGDPYRAAAPTVTAATRAGDCKAKALWLYDQLGDGTALYVIGKASKAARNSHAWVYWRSEGQWWILDPTNRSAPVALESLPSSRYVPYYSFGKAGAFRHRATRIFVANVGSETLTVADREPRLRASRR